MISKAIRIAVFIIIQLIHKRLPVQENKILFLSDVRDMLDGNLKFVWDEIIEDCWQKEMYCRDKQLHHQTLSDIKAVSMALNTSKYILLEDVMPFLEFYTLKEGQEIIQLWHAAGAYKKFGFSRSEDGLRVSKGHKKYTKAITSSDSIVDCYAEAYGIDRDRIAATGVPRTDIFFDEEWKQSVRNKLAEQYPQIRHKKVVLFAPTYRGTHIGDAGYNMDMLPFDKLREVLGDEFVFITKWHPAMYNNLKSAGAIACNDGFVIDLSHIRDVNSIMPAADILVTDYSSIIFEWSLLDRPIVYYAYDIDEYINDRGLYYPFEEYVYGKIAKNPAELADAISKMQIDENARSRFIAKFMNRCDGNAAKRVVDLMKES